MFDRDLETRNRLPYIHQTQHHADSDQGNISLKKLRKFIFWCHLTTGAFAGLVILTMSVTGVLLTYQRQMTAWADSRNCRASSPSSAGPRLTAEALLARVRESQLPSPTSITVRQDPAEPVAIAFATDRTLFLDPRTGEMLGEESQRIRSFFRGVTDWHRWLGSKGESRATFRGITGACNLGFLFLVSSGFYLWWPRSWTPSFLRNVVWFKRGIAGKARDFNWHNVIGLWCAVPLFLIVLSGAVISYPWASNLVYRVVGEDPPAPRPAPANGAGARATERRSESEKAPEIPLDGLDRLWETAERQTSDWRTITLRLPASAVAPVVFAIDAGDGGQPQKRAQLSLDRQSGEVVQWEPFSSYTTGRQLRSILRFAHTGEVVGIFGQTVAGLASAGGAVLVWTGLALALRRFRSWAAARSRAQVPALSELAQAKPSNVTSELSSSR
jgi:uncharacterized iron-regulated membrane protein